MRTSLEEGRVDANRDAEGDVILSDGTKLEDLIDRKRRTVSARVHSDQAVFELELAMLFARAWIPVAHRSEFEKPGDFVTRHVGRDPVIVTLDFDGEIRVMLNVCSHRGAQLCRAEIGNARLHTCPFHGWAYGADGRLVGVPHERLIYGDRVDRAEHGLHQARVGVLAGIVFACWDDEAPGLEEFFGGYRFYLDAMLRRSDAGMEVSGPPQRFVVDANWKLLVEGAFGDAYHVMTLHRSLIDVGVVPQTEELLHQFKASMNGHAVMCGDLERMGLHGDPAELLANYPPPGMPSELVGELDRNLSAEQISMLAKTPPSIAGLFPSTSLLLIGDGGGIGPVVSLRFFVPIAPDKTEFLSFSLVERDAPQEFKDRVHKNSIACFGIGGFFEEDDVEVFAGLQRGLEGVIARRVVDCHYDAVGGSDHAETTGPGSTHRGVSNDDNQWAFFERYFEFLGGQPW
jgi:phenylpropionate dioxygenase-like ring-hydroxylating dioxygenase large terminal subunit